MILIFAFLTVKKINSKGPTGGNRVLGAWFSNFFQRKKKIRVSSDYDVILHRMLTSSSSQMTLLDPSYYEALRDAGPKAR